MKMILQKHTSKFVAGLFNSLGITACIALTSCGDQDKSKQTENQGEDLKNGLIGKGLGVDEAKAIADWLNSNGKDSTYKLTAKDLQEIFQNDSSKLNEVAKKLGVKLTESDPEPNEEKNKEIQKWVTKLNSLNVAAFNELGGDLKEKVAQKFIVNNVDITNDVDIQIRLAVFIREIENEEKEREISLNFVGNGKVSITKVASDEVIEFSFDTFDSFEEFVSFLSDKRIVSGKKNLSFVFEEEKVKVDDHKTGFNVTGCFRQFLDCFEILARLLEFTVPSLSLGVTDEGVILRGNVCKNEFYGSMDFWVLVKDRAALLCGGGLGNDDDKFIIEKKGNDGSATVTINGWESSLEWSKVVRKDGKTFVEDSGWENIFKIKDKIPASTTKKDVTVLFEKGKCICSEIEKYERGVELNSLEALNTLVGDLNGKTVTIGENKKFSLAFEGVKVFVCGGKEGFVFTGEKNVFGTLLQYVVGLKELKAVDDKFQIKIEVDTNDIKLGGGKINQEFMKTENFWGAVKAHKELFDFSKEDKKIQVSKVSSSKKVKIGNAELGFDVLDNDDGNLTEGWGDIFKV